MYNCSGKIPISLRYHMTLFRSRFLIKIFFTAMFCVGVLLIIVYVSQKRGAIGIHTKQSACIIPGQKIDAACLNRELDNLIVTQGADMAMELLADAARSDDQFMSSCHGLAHRIGQETYRAFAQGKDMAISPKITYCTYGFYHGFMEAAAQLNGDYKKIVEFCAVIDKKLKAAGLDSSSECFHGIGHGAVEEHDINKNTDIHLLTSEALQLCEQATQVMDQKINCASGVFNGIANAYTSGQYGLSINQESPAQICKSQPAYAKPTCYAFMARVYLALAQGDFIKAIVHAQKTAEQDSMDLIVSNAAVIYAGRYLKENLDPVVLSCRSLDPAWRDACIKGAVIGLAQFSPPEQEYHHAIRLCRLPLLSAGEKERCIRELFTELKKIYPHEQLRALCEDNAPAERPICISLARE